MSAKDLVASKVKMYRQDLQISIREAAEQMQMYHTLLWRIEEGKSPVDVDTLHKLCEWMNKPSDEVIGLRIDNEMESNVTRALLLQLRRAENSLMDRERELCLLDQAIMRFPMRREEDSRYSFLWRAADKMKDLIG